MTSPLRRSLIVCLLLTLAGCGASVPSAAPVNQIRADEIADQVQRIRQLTFLQPVPVVVRDNDYVARQFEVMDSRRVTDDEYGARSATGAFLGLFPIGTNLKGQNITFAHHYIAGYYDPLTKEMLVRSSGSASDLLNERKGRLVLAHEYTHALQDQHFNLEHRMEISHTTDDMQTSRQVREGDAVVTEYGYDAGKIDNAVLDKLIVNVDRESQHPMFSEEIIEGPLIALYADGIRFVAEAYRRGGWEAVNALYTDPPRSTHQILHPQAYFDHRLDPVEIEVNGFSETLPGWTPVDRDTYGEAAIQQILERNLDKKAPEVALAAEWRGDQVVTLRSPDNRIAVIWMLSFSSEDSASSFTAAYTKILDHLLHGTDHRVERRHQAALVIIGVPAESAAQEIWLATRTGPSTVAGLSPLRDSNDSRAPQSPSR